MGYVILLQTSGTSYMFWPPFVDIFREEFYEGYVTKELTSNV
jgi:hypothetical protein